MTRSYEIYDQHVDIVSAFEWIFTEVADISSSVAHFERFPRVKRKSASDLTPDFTVVFNDGTSIIAEIAQIGLPDGSVESLCKQLLAYSEATSLPLSGGQSATVDHVSVVHITPIQVGMPTIQRVLKDRYQDPDHPFKPKEPPTILQYARADQIYVFQRIPDPVNGTINDANRVGIGSRFLRGNSLNIRASQFTPIKAARAFMNDPIDALYLATHLWTRVWPTVHGSSPRIETSVAATTAALKRQQDIGRAKDVKRAMGLLENAGLAVHRGDGTWVVSRRLLGRSGDRDVPEIIARRAVSPSTKSSLPSDAAVRHGVQGELW